MDPILILAAVLRFAFLAILAHGLYSLLKEARLVCRMWREGSECESPRSHCRLTDKELEQGVLEEAEQLGSEWYEIDCGLPEPFWDPLPLPSWPLPPWPEDHLWNPELPENGSERGKANVKTA